MKPVGGLQRDYTKVRLREYTEGVTPREFLRVREGVVLKYLPRRRPRRVFIEFLH